MYGQQISSGRECTVPQQRQTEAEKQPLEAAKLDSVEVRDVMGFAKLMAAGVFTFEL